MPYAWPCEQQLPFVNVFRVVIFQPPQKTCFSAACYSSGLYVTSPNVTHCYSVLSLPGSVMCFFKGFHELSYLYQNSYFFKARYVFPAVTHYDKIVVAGQACKSFLFTQLNICNQKLIKLSDNFVKIGFSKIKIAKCTQELGVHCIKGPAVDLNLISYLCLFSSAIHTRTSKQYQKLFLNVSSWIYIMKEDPAVGVELLV